MKATITINVSRRLAEVQNLSSNYIFKATTSSISQSDAAISCWHHPTFHSQLMHQSNSSCPRTIFGYYRLISVGCTTTNPYTMFLHKPKIMWASKTIADHSSVTGIQFSKWFLKQKLYAVYCQGGSIVESRILPVQLAVDVLHYNNFNVLQLRRWHLSDQQSIITKLWRKHA